jgi:CxxC motif-containing protein
MIKKLTCIECPRGCALSVDVENCRVVSVSGNQCPKGEGYAIAEIENPSRILTATVIAQGLNLKLVPVRTDRPIPKAKIQEAMQAIRKLCLERTVEVGDVIVKNFLGLGVNLIASRSASFKDGRGDLY